MWPVVVEHELGGLAQTGGVRTDDHDPLAATAVKRTAMLLRDARAVLRRLDTLAATAAAIEDPSLARIAEARSVVERLVSEYGHRE
jgi:hypothetical protein